MTQVTTTLVDHDLGTGLARGALMLGVIFYMYGGYAWLTNAVAVDRAATRSLLLGGMAGYLVIALAIPEAFGDSGPAFGIAYVAVVAVHAGLFARADSEGVRQGIRAIAPFNLGGAALVLAGGLAGGTAQYVLWSAACALFWVTPLLARIETFDVEPGHFVERHGLVVIVVIGESVVAIGVGAHGLALDLALVAVAVLALALSVCFWWTYFAGDDRRAEQALRRTAPRDRPRVAIEAFGYAHLALLLGVIAAAAGVKAVLAHPADELGAKDAVLLAGGAALFLASDVAFRRTLRIATGHARAVAVPLLAATVALGLAVGGAAQLAALIAVLAGALALES